MIRQILFCTFYSGAVLLALSCAVHPRNGYLPSKIPQAPDYSRETNWAALPDRHDLADSLPTPDLQDVQLQAPIDVFFLHPTTYTKKKGNNNWNGPVDDPQLNRKTDESTILYQASIFNGVGKVYAPRYRQAHIYSYFTRRDTASARQAFDLAYEDIRRAFQYYLENYNQGRPIIIASHSQGATHGIRLIKEFFDNQPLRRRLVAAYLVGMPVRKDVFQSIEPCQTPDQTGCFCSWRTFKRNYEPRRFPLGPGIAVTNPLSWTMEPALVPQSANRGAILRNFDVIYPNLANAQINNGILWTDKPRFPWSFLLINPNYHIADYNLFYLDVRENARLRAAAFIERDKE